MEFIFVSSCLTNYEEHLQRDAGLVSCNTVCASSTVFFHTNLKCSVKCISSNIFVAFLTKRNRLSHSIAIFHMKTQHLGLINILMEIQ